MASDAQRLAAVTAWEQRAAKRIADAQAEADYRRSLLVLRLESSPLPFRPSPVLVQLIRSQRQARQHPSPKQSKRSVEYLERKLEAEVRQHYELETAQHCAEWKRLHLQSLDARRALADAVESDFGALCAALQLDAPPADAGDSAEPAADGEQEADEWLRAHQQQHWLAQERFSVQEALTNQTRRLQTDLREYLAQLEADFERARGQLPPAAAAAARSEPRADRDVSAVDWKADALRRRLELLREEAEAAGRDRMAHIGRQCAHLFTQLDCKEPGDTLARALAAQEAAEMAALARRVQALAYVPAATARRQL